jgi:UDP-N-acetylmuramate dehydrogenase
MRKQSKMPFQSGFEHILREREPMAPYTWLRLGGEAEYFAEPTNVDELAQLVQRCRENDTPVRLVGGGSNVLVRDEGVHGLVIHLSAAQFGQVRTDDDGLTAGGGAKLSHAISVAVRDGLAGLEQLAGIPGTIGGALHGNATCHGTDIGHGTQSATVLTHAGQIVDRSRSDFLFAYRESSLDELVILEARFDLERSEPRELTKRMQKLWIVNKAAQPLRDQRAAMLFKDPGGISAASLIDQAGLHAARVGGVELSDRNANYAVAEANATSRDMLGLMDYLREGVMQRLGVELETAIDIW